MMPRFTLTRFRPDPRYAVEIWDRGVWRIDSVHTHKSVADAAVHLHHTLFRRARVRDLEGDQEE